jgi:hypothetical protein
MYAISHSDGWKTKIKEIKSKYQKVQKNKNKRVAMW